MNPTLHEVGALSPLAFVISSSIKVVAIFTVTLVVVAFMTLLERWTDQAALDVHSKVNATRPPLPAELRVGTTEREDYTYNRTR